MTIKLTMTAALLAAGLAMPAAAQERVSIGTGGTGGLFYIIGAGIADVINKHLDGFTARAEVTGASVENVRRVAEGQLTMGLSSSSTLYEAKNGQGPFDGTPLPVAGMAYLYPAVLQIATTGGTGIATLDDLAGKRVALGPPGSNSAVLAQRLLEAYGVFEPSKAQFLSYTEGVAALTNGQVDAAVVLAGAPTAALIDLDAQEDMVLLSLDPAKVEKLFADYPYYQPYDIPAGTYSDQTAPVTVINDPATLMVAEATDAGLVQQLTGAIFDNLAELAQVHPQAAAISLETGPNTPIPLHPGADAYFAGKQ
ncbi:MAG TPA: TAXI family TRAP transporter solute-binding subunit [Paracoccus sp. (in: a-proteobacteria)]|uniref:TAXI family TRAP transporter solute-binding subunit n=1 Tax=uncultured Paracoccus sp. TaxID=189685 RepID=UPI00261083DA|nr:TAXI family TRAP transporter solute-binding subunit [uncultured Paracoccus sp.]HMQ41484.1 TAXI family TRAP transporter solute-binding subunit [Paracoccus sp. (in: a-proteobacteria)]HMR36069.1 TAXI family TRAP transporter solute-binding subunit [Paracoccus sp. (in: a-proteobacteria)]